MMVNITLAFLVALLFVGGFAYSSLSKDTSAIPNIVARQHSIFTKTVPQATGIQDNASPLSIMTMRQKHYTGSVITIEQKLSPGEKYNRYVVSYLSEGLKVYGLLTVPFGKKPVNGWPVILFNHGYIPPAAYSTVASYSIMVNPLARAGYIVFKPDYRGNGSSEGQPTQPYISPNDITDSMNALYAIKNYSDANPQRIGVFGHSMGGNISLHELVLTHDLKAAELMSGVIGDETGIVGWWEKRITAKSIMGNDLDTSSIIEQMLKEHGTPISNPIYWDAIDSTHYLSFIEAPVQIQVGSADAVVPIAFSSSLNDALQKAGKTVDYYVYSGADHNLAPDTASAMAETVAFFNKYLR